MNDQTQQQVQPQQQPQMQPMAPFAGAAPYSNAQQQQKQNMADVVYGPGKESMGVRVEQTDVAKPVEAAPEAVKIPEIHEKYTDIERKDQKQYYPQNQQQQQVQPQQQVQQQVASSLKPQQPAPKFYGYMVSPQIANNHALISSLKGRGETNKSRTWIYMLLDRILKKQTYVKKHAV